MSDPLFCVSDSMFSALIGWAIEFVHLTSFCLIEVRMLRCFSQIYWTTDSKGLHSIWLSNRFLWLSDVLHSCEVPNSFRLKHFYYRVFDTLIQASKTFSSSCFIYFKYFLHSFRLDTYSGHFLIWTISLNYQFVSSSSKSRID